jgi:hypothetical protein
MLTIFKKSNTQIIILEFIYQYNRIYKELFLILEVIFDLVCILEF